MTVEPEDATDNCTFELTNTELTSLYLSTRGEFRKIVKRAEKISLGTGGQPSSGRRMFWGSVLFTRIVVTAKSLDRLAPDPRPREHWDFSSAAAVSRNLFEACLVFQYLCGEGPSEELREARFILFDLHDHGSRKRLLPDLPEPPEVQADLIRRFDANPHLAAFDDRRRKVALRGEKTPFIQDDVLAEMDFDQEQFRLIYRLLSHHTHTGPLSFYRMVEHNRGAGVETAHEKRYMIMTLRIASDFLVRTIQTHLHIFPDAETRKPYLTRGQITANVEREQGRKR